MEVGVGEVGRVRGSDFSSGNIPPNVGGKDLFHLWLLSES